jgi:uncharacterized membrane protein YfcA
MGNAGGAVVGMLVGAVLLIMLADTAPRVVNGLLVLILVGLVLAHSNSYTKLLQQWSGQKK